MKELDNVKITDLSLLLNEDTTLKRYYPLIVLKDRIINNLISAGINNKYDFLSLTDEELLKRELIPEEYVALFKAFLHLHDFKERKLAEITSIKPAFIQSLSETKIKKTSQYIKTYKDNGLDTIVREYNTDLENANKLLCLCDLMRLPGVKNIRAELYYNCGVKTINDFSKSDAESMRSIISDIITEKNLSCSVPLLKELKTQIAVAKVLPKII